jgi:hypothetical protein
MAQQEQLTEEVAVVVAETLQTLAGLVALA